MSEHSGSSNVTYHDCARRLRSEGYVHTWGAVYAKIVGRTRMVYATVKRDETGAHWIEYGSKG